MKLRITLVALCQFLALGFLNQANAQESVGWVKLNVPHTNCDIKYGGSKASFGGLVRNEVHTFQIIHQQDEIFSGLFSYDEATKLRNICNAAMIQAFDSNQPILVNLDTGMVQPLNGFFFQKVNKN